MPSSAAREAQGQGWGWVGGGGVSPAAARDHAVRFPCLPPSQAGPPPDPDAGPLVQCAARGVAPHGGRIQPALRMASPVGPPTEPGTRLGQRTFVGSSCTWPASARAGQTRAVLRERACRIARTWPAARASHEVEGGWQADGGPHARREAAGPVQVLLMRTGMGQQDGTAPGACARQDRPRWLTSRRSGRSCRRRRSAPCRPWSSRRRPGRS